jgi:magnesium-transporting ATPase (P-type)
MNYGMSLEHLNVSQVNASNILFISRYIGLNKDPSAPWPYNQNLEPPKWSLKPSNWLQVYMLFITLLNNFVPLSLYVTIEMVTLVMRMLINLDINMYDVYTDTRTVARSTTVTDLGQVQYIFSDKTGTLTQNVMKFKRCSVDSLVFGAPIVKEKLGENEGSSHPFHPLSKLLIGKLPEIPQNSKASVLRQHSDGLVGNMSESSTSPRALTFNAEMFLRVMSLCHTVVVEKDLDLNDGKIKATESNKSRSFGASIHRKIKKKFGKKTSPPEVDVRSPDEAEVTPEEEQPIDLTVKGNGGAPSGFAYQAESPDEGALVEASSLQFNFQVVARDSLGIRVSMAYPSLLSDPSIADGLKDGSLNEMQLAADTASTEGILGEGVVLGKGIETWEVLAVNKFDSTRKRMSVIVRSPPELGSIPMVLVKGADSAMLDPKILRNPAHIMIGDEDANDLSARASEPNIDNAVEWDKQAVLSMQSHLGEFAREGLRTLVLGVRVLSESECSEWLSEYASAAASLKNRDAKLTAAAAKIEAKIHIVGATAIEDKLQDGVPETIAHLGKAGIKLWVLTGDKRETAMEIGYATNVLNEKMRPGLTVVSQGSASEVQTKMAMAFLALIKHAKLPEYQKSSIGEDKPKRLESVLFTLGKRWRRFSRAFRRGYHRYFISIFLYLFSEVNANSPALKAIDEEERKEEEILQLTQRYRNVRSRAEKIVRDYLNSPEGMAHRRKQTKVEQHNEVSIEDMNMPSEGPDVFHRADSARQVLSDRRNVGQLSESELRDLTMVNLTAHEVSSGEFGLVDEDLLSMKSFLPTDDIDIKKTFDSRRRNILEKVFAVDKDVRHGRLKKHMNKSVLSSIEEDEAQEDGYVDPALSKETASLDGSRGLVIEGAALEKLLGDSELEEILFAVANTCNSVIACRVSPAQKAQLVQLVRRYVVPEPVTLAIGDGANDVGMIQEAHVGIGISGKEGQQAVNASDFAIAQFRFLLDLTLIHGRWNFMRLSTVVLFSFYKNAVMAGVLIVFSRASMFSGSPLFDEWLIAMLNFVAAMPIIVLGAFDRCLDRQYVLKHPETYTATRRNELITKRTLMRWIILIIIHIFCVYFLSVPMLSVDGAGSTSAFQGLMSKEDPDRPGNGEGGDLKSVGFVAFSSMILLFCYKVLWESRSIVIGQWPAFRCWKKGIEGWPNRLAYTWLSCGYCSIAFYLFAIYLYQALGRYGPSSYSAFVDTVFHAFNTRVRTWMALIFIPITAMSLDIAGKVFSNLFFPTQTQIHVEIFATGKRNCNPTSMLKCCGKGSSNQSNPEVSV